MVSFGGATFQLEAAINDLKESIDEKIETLRKSSLYLKYTQPQQASPNGFVNQLKIQEFIKRAELNENKPDDVKTAEDYLIAEEWIVDEAITSFLGDQKLSNSCI